MSRRENWKSHPFYGRVEEQRESEREAARVRESTRRAAVTANQRRRPPPRAIFDSDDSDATQPPSPQPGPSGMQRNPKTPVKRGAAGPTPDPSPAKQGSNMSQDNEQDMEEDASFAPQSSSSRAPPTGGAREANPNNSEKITTILRPLGTPDCVIPFIQRKSYVFQPFTIGTWAPTTYPGELITVSQWQTIPDMYMGFYLTPTELNDWFSQDLPSWNSWEILEAGWECKSLQLYSLNLIDPGTPKWVNSNNQDPYIYTVTDPHDIPAHWSLTDLSGNAVSATTVVTATHRADYIVEPANRVAFSLPPHQAVNASGNHIFPQKRLTQLDKASFVGTKRKLNCWNKPMRPETTPTDTITRGSTTIKTNTMTGAICSGGTWFMTNADYNVPTGSTSAADRLLSYERTPVGPVCGQDWSLWNPHTNLPSTGGPANNPMLIKIQAVQNPDNSLVENRIEMVLETHMLIRFKWRGYCSGFTAPSTIGGNSTNMRVFNKLAHNLHPPPNRNVASGIATFNTLFMTGTPLLPATATVGGIDPAFFGHHAQATIKTNNAPNLAL